MVLNRISILIETKGRKYVLTLDLASHLEDAPWPANEGMNWLIFSIRKRRTHWSCWNLQELRTKGRNLWGPEDIRAWLPQPGKISFQWGDEYWLLKLLITNYLSRSKNLMVSFNGYLHTFLQYLSYYLQFVANQFYNLKISLENSEILYLNIHQNI